MSRLIRLLCFAISLVWAAGVIAHVQQPALHAETADTRLTVADADVRSGKPTQASGKDQALRVGIDSSSGDGEMRSLAKFNLADLQTGGIVSSAQLSLYLAGTTTENSPMQITASRIQSNWDENVSWNSHLALAVDPNNAAATFVGTTFGWYTWDLTAMVQAWANDPNHGSELSILLQGQGPSARRRGFWSKDCTDNDCQGNRPKLDIDFVAPTATPTATPTLTSTPTPGAEVSISVEPVFPHSEFITVASGSLITYTVSIHNINAPLSDVVLKADAEIETNGPPMVVLASISDGGAVGSKEVIWFIGSLQPGDEANYTYAMRIPSGRTLYFPPQYLFNDGARLTWTYPGGSGSAKTRPLRNPPFYELLIPIIRYQKSQ